MDIPPELTEQYVIDRTDMYLGTVALHAAQVRTVLHQNAAMKKLLLSIRFVLRVLWETYNNKEAERFVKQIDDMFGDTP